MAFSAWKDRVTATPHRYKLTEVATDTYDFEAVPGAVSEAGTPVNAENLDRLIQRDGDDIKDTVVAFTEAGTRANIETGEKTSTIFGKLKKWFADLKPHAFNALATVQGTETDKAPTNKLLTDSSYAAVYLSLTDSRLIGITTSSTIANLCDAMVDGSYLTANTSNYTNICPPGETDLNGQIEIIKVNTNRVRLAWSYQNASKQPIYFATYKNIGGFLGWHKYLDVADISTIMPISSAAASNNKVLGEKVVYDNFAPKASPTFTGTVIVPTTPSGPSAAVAKSYVDGLSTPYSKVIRTQTEFEDLIGDEYWFGAVSVALVGQFTATESIVIPATVKQIHGYNGAKITITISTDSDTVGLGYETKPTTTDYSYKDIFVELINTNTNNNADIYAIKNMVNLYSPIAKAINYNEEGTYSPFGIAVGIAACDNVVNPMAVGLRNTALAVTSGYAFKDINGCVNAKILPGFTRFTDMWLGTNTNIDLDTCCKTPVTANNTTLNT